MMSANIKALRDFQRWWRGAEMDQPAPAKVGELLDWEIAVCEAAKNLVAQKGQHNTEIAYKRLEEAVKKGG